MYIYQLYIAVRKAINFNMIRKAILARSRIPRIIYIMYEQEKTIVEWCEWLMWS